MLPVVKTRLVEQQDLAMRQVMDKKDVEIQKLQQQVVHSPYIVLNSLTDVVEACFINPVNVRI